MMRRNTLHEPLTLDGFADLIARVECRAHRNGIRPPKGITQCRKALELMEEHTDSVMETILRLTLECYGLPRPVVNLPVRLPDGRLIFWTLRSLKPWWLSNTMAGTTVSNGRRTRSGASR